MKKLVLFVTLALLFALGNGPPVVSQELNNFDTEIVQPADLSGDLFINNPVNIQIDELSWETPVNWEYETYEGYTEWEDTGPWQFVDIYNGNTYTVYNADLFGTWYGTNETYGTETSTYYIHDQSGATVIHIDQSGSQFSGYYIGDNFETKSFNGWVNTW